MANEAEKHRYDGQDGCGDIRSQLRSVQGTAQNGNQDRQACQPNKRAGSVDSETANPLCQVIAARAEDEPFVVEKRNRDGDDVRENCSIHVAERAQTGKEPIEECEDAVAENGIETANEKVTDELLYRSLRTRFHLGMGQARS